MDYLGKVFGKKQRKLLIISGIALVLGFIILLIGIKFSRSMKAENLAARWSKDNDYAQVSLFVSELAGFNENNVQAVAFATEKKLREDSITAAPEARTWVYAYASVGKVTINSRDGSASVKALGVGGDFFLFHPFDLIEGSFFNSENVNDDLIVIDRETSFNLFGSTDVVGQIVEIDGCQFVVSGVIERDDGRLNRLAGNDEPTAYLSYSALYEGDEGCINMYEALIPNPISHYARDLVESNAGVEEKYFEIVENTGRYYFTNLLKNATRFGTRSMNSKGIIYPYWENMARGLEDYLTPLAVLGTICFLFPALVVICLIIRMWRLRPVHFSDIKDFLERLAENSREKRRRAKADKEDLPVIKPAKKKKKKKAEPEEAVETETDPETVSDNKEEPVAADDDDEILLEPIEDTDDSEETFRDNGEEPKPEESAENTASEEDKDILDDLL